MKKVKGLVASMEQLEEIEAGRYEIADKTDTPLQNLIDGIIELYLSSLYKLRFLA